MSSRIAAAIFGGGFGDGSASGFAESPSEDIGDGGKLTHNSGNVELLETSEPLRSFVYVNAGMMKIGLYGREEGRNYDKV